MTLSKRILRRLYPSHATVVAYLALSMAMGGTAYAAVQWTSADIADGSLLSVDVADNSLTGADISAGSITSSDLAPGAVLSEGGSPAGSLLRADSNPTAVTGPLNSTDGSAPQSAASVTFNVPGDKSYAVLVSAQAVITKSGDMNCEGYSGGSGDSLSVYADEDYEVSLLGLLHGRLPGGAIGGSQTLVFGPGDHTVTLANSPYRCQSTSAPGTLSVSSSFLTVSLLAEF